MQQNDKFKFLRVDYVAFDVVFASKFSNRLSDLNSLLFVNLDRNLFAFYFTKDKIAPKRSVDLDYFRIFS